MSPSATSNNPSVSTNYFYEFKQVLIRQTTTLELLYAIKQLESSINYIILH